MPVEMIGWIAPRVSSELIPPSGPPFDANVLAETARIHERAGFDRVLIGPPADALAPALAEAMQTANKRCRVGVLKADEATFAALAGPFAEKSEGSAAWVAGAASPEKHNPNERATLVGAAWWTDALGRKPTVAGVLPIAYRVNTRPLQ